VAQERAARQLTLAGQATSQQAAGQSSDGQAAGVEQGLGAAQAVSQATGTGPVAETQAKPDPAQSDAAQADGSSGGRALAQAMRRAAQAYQSCQSCFAGPEPMLQAVA